MNELHHHSAAFPSALENGERFLNTFHAENLKSAKLILSSLFLWLPLTLKLFRGVDYCANDLNELKPQFFVVAKVCRNFIDAN